MVMPFWANEAEANRQPTRQAHGHRQMRESGNGGQLAGAWPGKGIALTQIGNPCSAVGLRDDDIDLIAGKHLVQRFSRQPA